MEDSVASEKRLPDTSSEGRELETLTAILALLNKIDQEARTRIFQAAATFFGFTMRDSSEINSKSYSSAPHKRGTSPESSSLFSEDRTISPKQFMFEKQPKTDVEKVACLAYYLTHYRDTPHFKTLDISKLNTEAAQIKFANPTVAVDNASKLRYLVPATKGNKQISALGEQFVQALPDREKAKDIMSGARPLRRKPLNRKVQQIYES